jgi:uncharacterized membrane protein YciS (DUF1049 family)
VGFFGLKLIIFDNLPIFLVGNKIALGTRSEYTYYQPIILHKESNMNLVKALSYPFEDKQWASKIGLGVLISIIPILNFAWLGYVIEVMRRVMKGETLPMPGWDELGKKFMDGLMLFLSGLVYALPVILLIGIPLAIMMVPTIMAANNSSQDIVNALVTAGGVVALCLTCVFFLYGLALSVLFPAIYIEYARKSTFASCFNFKEIFSQIRKNTPAFFTAWGVYLGISIGASLAAGIIGGLIGWIPCLGQLIAVVVGLAAGIYALLVYAHLFGQYGAMEGAQTTPVSA